jgi:hypothetical protein
VRVEMQWASDPVGQHMGYLDRGDFGIRDRGMLVRCFVFGLSPLLRARDSWFGSGERVPFFRCLSSAWIAELSWFSFSCAVGLGIVVGSRVLVVLEF